MVQLLTHTVSAGIERGAVALYILKAAALVMCWQWCLAQHFMMAGTFAHQVKLHPLVHDACATICYSWQVNRQHRYLAYRSWVHQLTLIMICSHADQPWRSPPDHEAPPDALPA